MAVFDHCVFSKARLCVSAFLMFYASHTTTSAAATTFETIYSFGGGPQGYTPKGRLLLRNGWLYGTTEFGGLHDGGTIYKFNVTSHIFVVLHDFSDLNDDMGDGCWLISGLTSGPTGVVFGATSECSEFGTVFKFDPKSNGVYTVHGFTNANRNRDGLWAGPAPVIGKHGALYGVTMGSSIDKGSVFSVASDGTAFHVFQLFPGGSYPFAPLAFGAGSVLYGTTAFGGEHSDGTLFTVNTKSNKFKTIYTFRNNSIGESPLVALISDGKGHLFGGTSYYEIQDERNATIFRIGDGSDKDQVGQPPVVVYTFTGNKDGGELAAELTLDKTTGLFYGVSERSFISGKNRNNGSVFVFDPNSYALTTLHTFPIGSQVNGGAPSGPLLSDDDGTYYGVTADGGGSHGFGTIYRITP